MSVTNSISLMISLVAVIALKHAKFALNMAVHIILVWIMNFLVLGQTL